MKAHRPTFRQTIPADADKNGEHVLISVAKDSISAFLKAAKKPFAPVDWQPKSFMVNSFAMFKEWLVVAE